MEDEDMAQMRSALAAFPNDVAATVRDLRRERGWSQDAFARRMSALLPRARDGKPAWIQTTVAKVESAATPRTLSATELVALTYVFGLHNVEDLFGETSVVERVLAKHAHRERAAETSRMLEQSKRSLADMWPEGIGEELQRAFDEVQEILQAQVEYVGPELAVPELHGRFVEAMERVTSLMQSRASEVGPQDG